MMSHEAVERDVRKALDEINKMDCVAGPTMVIRVEEGSRDSCGVRNAECGLRCGSCRVDCIPHDRKFAIRIGGSPWLTK